MKHSKICPKCGTSEIRMREVALSSSSLTSTKYVFEAYICTTCKFSEFYLKFAGV